MDQTDFLEHFGIKGMHWGQRKDRSHGVSSHVNKEAQKDAKEFARAKAFYGTGAGTRKKLINQTVEFKAKKLPGYKKAFVRGPQGQATMRKTVRTLNNVKDEFVRRQGAARIRTILNQTR